MRDRRPGRDVFDHPYFLKRNMTNTFFSHFPPTVYCHCTMNHSLCFSVLREKGRRVFLHLQQCIKDANVCILNDLRLHRLKDISKAMCIHEYFDDAWIQCYKYSQFPYSNIFLAYS